MAAILFLPQWDNVVPFQYSRDVISNQNWLNLLPEQTDAILETISLNAKWCVMVCWAESK